VLGYTPNKENYDDPGGIGFFKNKHIDGEILFMRRNLEIKQEKLYLLGVHAIVGRLSNSAERTCPDPATCNPSRTWNDSDPTRLNV
jgi:hypothetical protein